MVTSESAIKTEDLSEAHELLDQRQTPFWSRLPTGTRPKDVIFGEGIGKMGKRRKGGVPERQDVKSFEGDKGQKLYARLERFQRTPAVSVEAQTFRTNNVVADMDYDGQVNKKIKENKRDIDYWLLSDQESAEDDGVQGYLLRGAGRFINDGSTGAATSTSLDSAGTPTLAFTDVITTPPDGYKTPASQIYAGTLAGFTEDNLLDIMEERAKRTGASAELTLWTGYSLKRKISTDFGRYQKEKAGFTGTVVTNTADIDKRKLVATGIDIFEGDYGVVMIEGEPWMPTNGRGYLLDMARVDKRVAYVAQHTEFDNKGGGRRGLIDSICGAWFDDPRAHGKIAPSDEVAAIVDFED